MVADVVVVRGAENVPRRGAIIFAANAYIAHREVQLARSAETSSPIEAAKPGE